MTKAVHIKYNSMVVSNEQKLSLEIFTIGKKIRNRIYMGNKTPAAN